MVDERSRPEPQLSAVLPQRVHDREVVLPKVDQLLLLLLGQLGDAADEKVDVLVLLPHLGRDQLGPDVALHGVPVAGLDGEARVCVEHAEVPVQLQTETVHDNHRLPRHNRRVKYEHGSKEIVTLTCSLKRLRERLDLAPKYEEYQSVLLIRM